MQIKINEKILSIPPYISTTWSRIVALYTKESELVIYLQSGNVVNIPHLPLETLEAIFTYHAAYLEGNQSQIENQPVHPTATAKATNLNDLLEQSEPSFRFAFGAPNGIGYAMQHNPNQSNAPNLPADLLEKIGAVAKILLPNEAVLAKAEPSCNCFYCQIIRTMHPEAINQLEEQAEITDTDLQFQQWNILQVGENLFNVSNRLDEKEKYSVYLGQPIGCTCGKEGCEHIIAVLKS